MRRKRLSDLMTAFEKTIPVIPDMYWPQNNPNIFLDLDALPEPDQYSKLFSSFSRQSEETFVQGDMEVIKSALPFLYIRGSYYLLADTIVNDYVSTIGNRDVKKFTVVGCPGINQRAFLVFLLYVMIKASVPVVVVSMGGEKYVYHNHCSYKVKPGMNGALLDYPIWWLYLHKDFPPPSVLLSPSTLAPRRLMNIQSVFTSLNYYSYQIGS